VQGTSRGFNAECLWHILRTSLLWCVTTYRCAVGTEHVSAYSSAQNAFKSAKFQSDHTLQVLTEQYWIHLNPMTLKTRFCATYS